MASNVADTGTRTKIIQDAGTGKLNRAVEAFRMEEEVLNEGQIQVGQDNRDLFDSSPENIRCQINQYAEYPEREGLSNALNINQSNPSFLDPHGRSVLKQ